jgi:hypothetical protein
LVICSVSRVAPSIENLDLPHTFAGNEQLAPELLQARRMSASRRASNTRRSR